jgi:predicted HicB family RNase H-like nuclease
MMQYKGYVGKVVFDDDAKIFHGEVIGIRDVVTFQADSVHGVDEAFRGSMDDYLAFCKERGEPSDNHIRGNLLFASNRVCIGV